MAKKQVKFTYDTGIQEKIFTNAFLTGSWDANGRYSDQWHSEKMTVSKEGFTQIFTKLMEFEENQLNEVFKWGVRLQDKQGNVHWGIPTEVNDHRSNEQVRMFRLQQDNSPQEEKYILNESRNIGAQKVKSGDNTCIRFSCWAPNAQNVEVVMGYIYDLDDPAKTPRLDINQPRMTLPTPKKSLGGGYIFPDGKGIYAGLGPFRMKKDEATGLWSTSVSDPDLQDNTKLDHAPYMFRVTKDDGSVVYRTDIFSRCQIGYGSKKPSSGEELPVSELDGTFSTSVIVDPDRITGEFEEMVWPEKKWIKTVNFWKGSYPERPRKLEDMIIYELHVGALGFGKGKDDPGDLRDTIAFLDYVEELGCNTIELLPLSEFGGGDAAWGYSTSHYFAIEYSGGGRDQFKFFIRECHRRGISVIFDVVYNHYVHNADRAQWLFDTDVHEKNMYYWYEGHPDDYVNFNNVVDENRKGHGGYVDNMSTGWAPRYYEEYVRKMFISSAVNLAVEFRVDGFRVDQTTSIHAYNRLHADGSEVSRANIFGQKLLRELTTALRLVKPDIVITAEDHSEWDAVTAPVSSGGLGFDAAWYSNFYHHLIGDGESNGSYAKLLKEAGYGDDRPLKMDAFAGALQHSGNNKIVYHESHDEAGNGKLTSRNIHVSVNHAPIIGLTRYVAEARCRVVAGLSLFSAGTPMFLFGEEVAAQQPFIYGKVLDYREDYEGLKNTYGAKHFRYYRDLILTRKINPGLKSESIDVFYTHNQNRIIAFKRWGGGQEYLVIASLNNRHFGSPSYTIYTHILQNQSRWKEVFNSNSSDYGGDNTGNGGGVFEVMNNGFSCVIPANSILLFQKVSGE